MAAVGFDLFGGCCFLGHEAFELFGKKLSEVSTTGENLIVVFLVSLQASSPSLSFRDSSQTSDLLYQSGLTGKFEP